DTREHRNTAVQLGDVINEFHDDDGLADAGATERTDFAAFQEGADEVNDFDPGHKHLRTGGLIDQSGCKTVNRHEFVRLHPALLVHGLAGHVENATHDGFADGHRNGRAGISDFHATLQTFGAAHGDGANPVV